MEKEYIEKEEENKEKRKNRLIIVIFFFLILFVLTGFILLGYYLSNFKPHHSNLKSVIYDAYILNEQSSLEGNPPKEFNYTFTSIEGNKFSLSLLGSSNVTLGHYETHDYIYRCYGSEINSINISWNIEEEKYLTSIEQVNVYVKEEETSSSTSLISIYSIDKTNTGFTATIRNDVANNPVIISSIEITYLL